MTFSILHILGFTGTGLIVLAVLYPIFLYHGKHGERFSLFNHFISELGEVGVSRAAWFFNAGLLLAGLVMLPYIVGLGIAFSSPLGWLGTAAGVIAVLGVAAVGVFPMNNIQPHTAAATTYFRAGLVMVFFFGLAIFFQPSGKAIIPQAANLLSLLAFLAYGAFLTLPLFRKKKETPSGNLDPEQEPERPRIWAVPTLEWLVFFSTIAWLFGMTFFI
jgi:hypothetical membrane protein